MRKEEEERKEAERKQEEGKEEARIMRLEMTNEARRERYTSLEF